MTPRDPLDPEYEAIWAEYTTPAPIEVPREGVRDVWALVLGAMFLIAVLIGAAVLVGWL